MSHSEGSSESELWGYVMEALKHATAVFNAMREDWVILGDFNARVGRATTYAFLEPALDVDSDCEYDGGADRFVLGRALERESVEVREPKGRALQLMEDCKRMRAVLLNGVKDLGAGPADWTFVSLHGNARSVVDYALCSSALYEREHRHIDFQTHGLNHEAGAWMADLCIDHAILSLRIPTVLIQHGKQRGGLSASEQPHRAKRVHPSAIKRRLVRSIDWTQWSTTCKQYLPPLQSLVESAFRTMLKQPESRQGYDEHIQAEAMTTQEPAADLKTLFSDITAAVDIAIEQTPKVEAPLASRRDGLRGRKARDADMQLLKRARWKCERQYRELKHASAPAAELEAARDQLREAARAARKRSLIVRRQHRREQVQCVEQLLTGKQNVREFYRQFRRLDYNSCPALQREERLIPDTVLASDGTERSGTEAVHAAHRAAWGAVSAYDPTSPAFDQSFHDELQADLERYSTQAASPGHDESVAAASDPWVTRLDVPITAEELEVALRHLRNNTRGSAGEWTYEILKQGGETMHSLLLSLLQVFFALEQVPDELRLGDIVIAFKDGDRRQPLDYRPLTLLHVVGKLHCEQLGSVRPPNGLRRCCAASRAASAQGAASPTSSTHFLRRSGLSATASAVCLRFSSISRRRMTACTEMASGCGCGNAACDQRCGACCATSTTVSRAAFV